MKQSAYCELTNGDIIRAEPIKGSPCFMVTVAYKCEDAPSGYYLYPGVTLYEPARDAQTAIEAAFPKLQARWNEQAGDFDCV